jgi:biotin carboxyl carrier protein
VGADPVDERQDGATAAAAGATAAAARVIGELADELLPALVHRLDTSDLGELEVRTAAWRVRLRKPFDRRASTAAQERRRRSRPRPVGYAHHDPADRHRGEPVVPVVPPAIGVHHHPHGPHGSRVGGTGEALQAPFDAIPATARTFARSPVVGYYVPRDGYAGGRAVRAGEVVGWVDCLGVRQDVIAPRDALVAVQLAQAGEAVEYGQPLIALDGSPAGATNATASATEAAMGSAGGNGTGATSRAPVREE